MLTRWFVYCLLTGLVLVGRVLAADLVFGIYDLPVRAFTTEEARTFPESGQADAAAVLRKRGFDVPEGSSAFYDVASARIFLRSTQRDLNHLQRIAGDLPSLNFEGGPSSGLVNQVQVTASCYALPLTALPPDFGPQSDPASLPADKLVLVDRVSLIGRSGQVARTETETGTDKEPMDADASSSREVSRTFEMGCTVSDNREVLDINLFWEIRSPKLAAPGRAGKFNIATQIASTPGGRFLQDLGATEEAEPRLVFLVLEPVLVPLPELSPPDGTDGNQDENKTKPAAPSPK